jgi:hypothetical protein
MQHTVLLTSEGLRRGRNLPYVKAFQMSLELLHKPEGLFRMSHAAVPHAK